MIKISQKNAISNNYSRHLIRGNVTGNLGINSAVRYASIYGENVNVFYSLKMIRRENIFRIWWYVLTLLAMSVVVAIYPQSWLFAIDVVVVLVNIDLVCRGKVIGIYIGIAECILYIFICSMSGLWGEVIKISTINIPLNIVTLVVWTKNIKQKSNGSAKGSIEIRKLGINGYLILTGLGIVCLIGGYFLLKALGTSSLYISVLTFTFGMLAKVLSSLRYKEAYYMSLTNQVLTVALWISMIFIAGPENNLMGVVMYIACISDSIYGIITWRGMYKHGKKTRGVILVKRPVKISNIIKLRRMYKNLHWDEQVDVQKNS